MKQRDDMAKLNATLQTELKAKGLTFNNVDPKPFQQALRDAGFYAEWKRKFGDEAWATARAVRRQAGLSAMKRRTMTHASDGATRWPAAGRRLRRDRRGARPRRRSARPPILLRRDRACCSPA